jgi:hypothetical protein
LNFYNSFLSITIILMPTRSNSRRRNTAPVPQGTAPVLQSPPPVLQGPPPAQREEFNLDAIVSDSDDDVVADPSVAASDGEGVVPPVLPVPPTQGANRITALPMVPTQSERSSRSKPRGESADIGYFFDKVESKGTMMRVCKCCQ